RPPTAGGLQAAGEHRGGGRLRRAGARSRGPRRAAGPDAGVGTDRRRRPRGGLTPPADRAGAAGPGTRQTSSEVPDMPRKRTDAGTPVYARQHSHGPTLPQLNAIDLLVIGKTDTE